MATASSCTKRSSPRRAEAERDLPDPARAARTPARRAEHRPPCVKRYAARLTLLLRLCYRPYPMPRSYPVMLHLAGRSCLVVGGGVVATRKVRSLLRAGADVTVVSPSLSAALSRLATQGPLV